MAFNFNWSPLTADAGFYTRAQELLTTALNKSPKPPIIVDDILVTELNLGHIPPELEILEIGDLAEDRFRGIFKMSYNGDAFLTLKTRVQANPLNTYLSTRSPFASPQPLAAATGLTIPLQITLSDIKLSAFIVLVFSRQKGLTLVFRNDPLESLKVSSTFDSIPFVRDYLQKEIDGQLRILLMDQLPAIIHRLSLHLWVPDYEQEITGNTEVSEQEPAIDPLASPPQDPVDSTGNALNPTEVASLSLDSSIETQSLFSHKNLLRLAALNESHRTLSLFTPSIREAVFRAWAGPTERGETTGVSSPLAPALSRSHSYAGSTTTSYTFPDSTSLAGRSHLSSGLSMGSGRHNKPHGTRKRRKRVVNLRKKAEPGEGESVMSGDSDSYATESVTGSTESGPASAVSPPLPLVEEDVEDNGSEQSQLYSNQTVRPRGTIHRSTTAPLSNTNQGKTTPSRKTLAGAFEPRQLSQQFQNNERIRHRSSHESFDIDATPRASMYISQESSTTTPNLIAAAPTIRPLQLPSQPSVPTISHAAEHSHHSSHNNHHSSLHSHPNSPLTFPLVHSTSSEKRPVVTNESTSPVSRLRSNEDRQTDPLPSFLQFLDPSNSASIAEQAWMMKMANEMARRYQEEKERMIKTEGIGNSGGSRSRLDDPSTSDSSSTNVKFSGRNNPPSVRRRRGEDDELPPPPAYAV